METRSVCGGSLGSEVRAVDFFIISNKINTINSLGCVAALQW